MLRICGMAMLVVVHEVLADGSACHRSDVLHRSRIGSRSRDDDRLVEDAVLLQGLADRCNRRGLLADSDVDADDIRVLLIHDRIDCNGGLARLAVADDELTLATSDRHHCINGKQACLDRLADRLALHDARSLELNRTAVRRVDRAKTVDRLAERIHDTAEHLMADRNVHDATGRAALVALLDGVDFAEQDRAHIVLVEVLRQAVHGMSRLRARELQKLSCHGRLESGDTGNAVADLGHHRRLLRIHRGGHASQLAAQLRHDGFGADLAHYSSPPRKDVESFFLMLTSCAFTEAS